MPRLNKHIPRLLISIFCISLLFSCGNDTLILKENVHASKSLPCIDRLESDSAELIKIAQEINAPEKTRRIDSIFQVKLQRSHFNGCAFVAQKGVVLYKKCFGNACLNVRQPDLLTPDTKFQLASLSKTFTAVAILKLYEEGKLGLGDTLQKYFPELPYKNITIQMLLCHRSGLPYYAYVFEDSIRKGKKYPNNEDVIRWMIEQNPDRYGYPDRGFAYNNTNYLVLASIIAQVSGMSYEEYIRTKICLPLGMKNTWVITTKNDSINQMRSRGHEGKRVVPFDYFDNVVGDKGIYSTINDLYRWYKSLHSECLLKKSTLEKAFSPYSFEHKGLKNYGLGFRVLLDKKTQKPRYIYHNGWWKGYNSLFWFIPEEEAVIIVLGNVRNRVVYDVRGTLNVIEGPHTEEVIEGEE